jgi:hypothetical protein
VPDFLAQFLLLRTPSIDVLRLLIFQIFLCRQALNSCQKSKKIIIEEPWFQGLTLKTLLNWELYWNKCTLHSLYIVCVLRVWHWCIIHVAMHFWNSDNTYFFYVVLLTDLINNIKHHRMHQLKLCTLKLELHWNITIRTVHCLKSFMYHNLSHMSQA